jgi:hypothetical protein
MRPLAKSLAPVVLVVALVGSACGTAPRPTTVHLAASTAWHSPPWGGYTGPTTTTTAPAPPVTVAAPAPHPARQRASRSAAPVAAPSAVPGGDFWRRLANCESSDGRSGTYLGYFQFSRDTAAKVGYRAGMSYEEQRALAIKWLGMIGGRGGSTSGWPVCWWRAGGH